MDKKEFAGKFIAKYKDYDITEKTEYWHENETNFESVYLIIKNPSGEADIRIMYDGNHVVENEMILSFSYHHDHFYTYYFPEGEEKNYADYFVRDLSETINRILEGEIVAVGFLTDGKPILCGASRPENIETLSAEEIFAKFKKYFPGAEYYEKVKGCECICSIRGWNNSHNKDLSFIIT